LRKMKQDGQFICWKTLFIIFYIKINFWFCFIVFVDEVMENVYI
jgi:hypothetical protein